LKINERREKLMRFDEPFSKEGFISILTGFNEMQSKIFSLEHGDLFEVSENLKELWKPQIQEPQPQVFDKRLLRRDLEKVFFYRLKTDYEKEPVWLISLSNQFTKDIQNVDRRLQGRILSAIGTIYKDPFTPKGDTIKPLSTDLKGFWRYRIGDYRLVYTIDRENKHIFLIAFASRGDIYES
jgi:addiction module RelE/StbE family toxin